MNNYLFRLLAFGLYVLFGLFFWFNSFEALSTYMSYLRLSYLFLTFFTYYLAKKAALSPMPYQSFLSALVLALICLLFPDLSLSVVVWLFIGLFLLAALFYLFSVWQNKENKHLISSFWHLYAFCPRICLSPFGKALCPCHLFKWTKLSFNN